MLLKDEILNKIFYFFLLNLIKALKLKCKFNKFYLEKKHKKNFHAETQVQQFYSILKLIMKIDQFDKIS